MRPPHRRGRPFPAGPGETLPEKNGAARRPDGAKADPGPAFPPPFFASGSFRSDLRKPLYLVCGQQYSIPDTVCQLFFTFPFRPLPRPFSPIVLNRNRGRIFPAFRGRRRFKIFLRPPVRAGLSGARVFPRAFPRSGPILPLRPRIFRRSAPAPASAGRRDFFADLKSLRPSLSGRASENLDTCPLPKFFFDPAGSTLLLLIGQKLLSERTGTVPPYVFFPGAFLRFPSHSVSVRLSPSPSVRSGSPSLKFFLADSQ